MHRVNSSTETLFVALYVGSLPLWIFFAPFTGRKHKEIAFAVELSSSSRLAGPLPQGRFVTAATSNLREGLLKAFRALCTGCGL